MKVNETKNNLNMGEGERNMNDQNVGILVWWSLKLGHIVSNTIVYAVTTLPVARHCA